MVMNRSTQWETECYLFSSAGEAADLHAKTESGRYAALGEMDLPDGLHMWVPALARLSKTCNTRRNGCTQDTDRLLMVEAFHTHAVLNHNQLLCLKAVVKLLTPIIKVEVEKGQYLPTGSDAYTKRVQHSDLSHFWMSTLKYFPKLLDMAWQKQLFCFVSFRFVNVVILFS